MPPRAIPETNEPKPTVSGWPDDRGGASQNPECRGDLCASHIRDITADKHNWPLKRRQSTRHALPQIASALCEPGKTRRPRSGSYGTIGTDREHHVPPWVPNVSEQPARLMAKPPSRVGHADISSQSGFDVPGDGFLDHDDQGLTPQRVATISRCGIPASMYSGPSTTNPSRS